jgi:hypothetical protein
MPFLAYYDGSGTHQGSKVLILAGFAAPVNVWASFNEKWRDVLNLHGVTELHMRKTAALFNRGDQEAIALVKGLFNVIGSFRLENFTAYSCAVLLDDYVAAKRLVPTLKAPEAICVNFCVGGLQLTAEDLSEREPICIHFDENEPFLKHLDRAWRLARKVNSRAIWARQIRHVVPVCSDEFPIQAADLFARLIYRYQYCNKHSFWAASTIIAAKHISQVYDYEGILQTYDARGMRLDRPAGNPRPLSIRLT